MVDEFDREFMVDYILEVTDYTIEDINKSAKNYGQLRQMYRRIKECMKTYPKEIHDYISTHNTDIYYSLEELHLMSYNELAALRTKLKIGKKGKKVVKTEPDFKQTELGRTIFDLMEEPEQMVLSFVDEEEPNEQILTDAEIKAMYGEHYSDKELREKGIIREGYFPDEEKMAEAAFYLMIGTIVDLNVTIAGHTLTYEECYAMGEQRIKALYDIVSNFIPRDNPKLNKRP